MDDLTDFLRGDDRTVLAAVKAAGFEGIQTGSMIADPFDNDLPHPYSPGARLSNPLGWMFWDQEKAQS